MERKTTRYEVKGRTALITLARSHRGNAWTGRMHTEYRAALAEADDDGAVRVIVVTGDGSAFCVGADAQALEGHADAGGYDSGIREPLATPGFGVHPGWDRDWAFHFGLSKPIVAAINGPAAGVGLVLASYCDIRFAVSGAKLTTAHGKLNLPAELGLSWLLPRLIGGSRAMEWLLSSRVVMTEEAHEAGFVTRLFEDRGALIEGTLAYAEDLAESVSRRSLLETRRQVWLDWHRDVGASLDDSDRLLQEMVRDDDFRRGVSALLERRPPAFE